MDVTALNKIQNLARALSTFAPQAGQNLRRALADAGKTGRSDQWKRSAEHAEKCYREQCDQARNELNELAKLVYAHLPEITPEYCRINPPWRMYDATTPWPAIVGELRTIEDAALRKLLTTPEPANQESTEGTQRAAEADNARANSILAAVADETGLKVIQIANSDLETDDKLRAIGKLDAKYKGWTSDRLGDLVGRTGAAVRATTWWRVDRKKETCE